LVSTQTNKRYESRQIKIVHESNRRAKRWYFKTKLGNVFINDCFLRRLKDTFIFSFLLIITPKDFHHWLRLRITRTLCASLNENLLNSECQHYRNWFLETKWALKFPQVSFYTEPLEVSVEIAADKVYDLLRPYQVAPAQPHRHILHWVLHSAH